MTNAVVCRHLTIIDAVPAACGFTGTLYTQQHADGLFDQGFDMF